MEDDFTLDCSEFRASSSPIRTKSATNGFTLNPELRRLATFFQMKISPNARFSKAQFVQAGFTFSAEENCIRCDFCNLKIREWNDQTNPFREHSTHSSNCQFVLDNKSIFDQNRKSKFNSKKKLKFLIFASRSGHL